MPDLDENSFSSIIMSATGETMAKKKNETRARVYKQIDLVGVSEQGFEQAIQSAVDRASDTLSDLRWFEVKEMRGAIQQGRISEYQVVVTVSFEVR